MEQRYSAGENSQILRDGEPFVYVDVANSAVSRKDLREFIRAVINLLNLTQPRVEEPTPVEDDDDDIFERR